MVRKQLERPFVTLKLAASQDGFIAPPSRTPVTITGEISRAHVHRERARCDAILVGGATLRGDAPRLDVRLPGLGARSPHRFVLSSQSPPEGWHRIGAPTDIATLEDVHHLYVEGGGATAQAFLAEGLVDRLMLYRAPVALGDGVPAFGALGPALAALPGGDWRCIDQRRLGDDTLSVYRPTITERA